MSFYYDLHLPLSLSSEFRISATVKRIRTNAQRYRYKVVNGNTLMRPAWVYWGQAVAYNAQNVMSEVLYENICRRLHGRVDVKLKPTTHISTKG